MLPIVLFARPARAQTGAPTTTSSTTSQTATTTTTTTTAPTAATTTNAANAPAGAAGVSTTTIGGGSTTTIVGASTTTTTTGGPPITALGPSTGLPSGKVSNGNVSISVGDPNKPSQSVLIIILLTVLSVAPSLLILMTSFTRIAVVLSLTRNALGLQSIPPNQVIVGLALFLSLFVMRPTLTVMNDTAFQPLLKGEITQGQAFDNAMKPMRAFMLKQTRSSDLEMFNNASGAKRPKTVKDVSMATLIPAFIVSELKTAFIIGFIVFIPFLVIDLIVSSALMSMGMMMLPPVLVSLPFKLLLFVMVDGWALIINALVKSFH